MMFQKYLELTQTGQFPKLLIDYLSNQPQVADFYAEYPKIENFKAVIERRKSFSSAKRESLVTALQNQYKSIENAPDFSILADEKTFTVVTGHQLNILTGPLYVVYKIITTINLARLLKIHYPEYNFVPVYWMASEDHDFAEIASVHLFDQKFQWNTPHGGAVGRLSPDSLAPLFDKFPEQLPLFKRAYTSNDTLTDAVRQYMHELFGSAGLISIDGDDAILKQHFIPIIEDELVKQSSEQIVRKTTETLQELGYHTPVHAREINLFYLKDNARERIVKNGDTYEVLKSSIRFSQEEILEDVQKFPENYSPNVVLRPLYQETILPNLAYIGGPSEVPYWLQLKGVFQHFKESFPILIPRNFALIVQPSEKRRLDKLKLSYEEIFSDKDSLRKQIVDRLSENELDLSQEISLFTMLFNTVEKKATSVDLTMIPAVEAEKNRLIKSFLKLEKRLHKAEERKFEVVLNQLQSVLDAFFPNGVPQERYHNFLNFYLRNSYFIADLFNAFDPLDFRFNILEEN